MTGPIEVATIEKSRTGREMQRDWPCSLHMQKFCYDINWQLATKITLRCVRVCVCGRWRSFLRSSAWRACVPARCRPWIIVIIAVLTVVVDRSLTLISPNQIYLAAADGLVPENPAASPGATVMPSPHVARVLYRPRGRRQRRGSQAHRPIRTTRPTAQPSALATRATEDPVQTMPSDVQGIARDGARLPYLHCGARRPHRPESGDKVRRQSIRHLGSSADVEQSANDSQKFKHLVKLQICFEVSLVYLTILEAAPTVTICDGALESVLRVMMP